MKYAHIRFAWLDYVQVALAGAGSVASAFTGNVAATIWAFVAMIASATLAYEKLRKRPATLFLDVPTIHSATLVTDSGTWINGEWFPPGTHTLWKRA